MHTNKRDWRLTTALYSMLIAVSAIGLGVALADDGHGKDDHGKDDHGQHDDNDNRGPGNHKDKKDTASPIKHVIILIGENRGLDHTFGVYKPKGHGEKISNLLSKGIVDINGKPGKNFKLAEQFSVTAQAAWYFGAPKAAKSPYSPVDLMPQPNTNGAPSAPSLASPPFQSAALVAAVEHDVNAEDIPLLTTGATGLPTGSLDTRVPGAGQLPNGPFLLQGPELSDDDYTGDTTHRYFQAAQQQDCSIAAATKENPTGCLNDLFPFVMVTYARNNSVGNSMGFYNAENGEAALMAELADRFTLSDNFHQSVLGGTAANHVMLGSADAVYWSDGNGTPIEPPANLIANPNPRPNTNNQYTVDGNLANCADRAQPGIAQVVDYLASLPYRAKPNCGAGKFYMINNINPGFLPNGALAGGGAVPPQTVRTIGDALIEKNVSWAFYGGAYNAAVALSNEAVNGNLAAAALQDPANALGVAYCQICNPFGYSKSIMGNDAVRKEHIKDTADLVDAIKDGTLPAVVFGKPDGLLDGHPQSSKYDLFEAYVQHLLDALDANPRLKEETAVFVTFDEAGGYWDSGFVQPIDFFGDGPRIPLLILSPYTTGGKVYHNYGDHVSLLKFIERNWGLDPLTRTTRDNLPNPKSHGDNPYVPVNMPALDDLFDAFDFGHPVKQAFTK